MIAMPHHGQMALVSLCNGRGLMRGVTGGDCLSVAPSHTERFVADAQRLLEKGNANAALDLIYDRIDAMMRLRQWSRLNSILFEVRVVDLSPDILLSLLTATLPARSRLPARGGLFGRIEQSLKQRGDYEKDLLIGLE